MATAQLVWDDSGVWRTATTRDDNHDQAIFWFPIKDPSRFQIYARLIERLARLHFEPTAVNGSPDRIRSTFREDSGSDYIIFQDPKLVDGPRCPTPLPDLPVALAMAPPQKQYRTESGGRWKCGVVYRAGTDTADPSVSDAVRAYKVFGQNFTDAVQEDGGCVDNGLHRLLDAAQRTMADSSVVALFRAAVGIRPPERVLAPLPLMPKQETDRLSERSWDNSRPRSGSHVRRLSRSRSPRRSRSRSREEHWMRGDPGSQHAEAQDPIPWDQLEESTTVLWDTVENRAQGSLFLHEKTLEAHLLSSLAYL
ncbi:hypothetical protein FOZ61_000366 [Perkinsus olseni]|uniref:Uncharacterized protein n=1 Tax=Perkinsus olseni TaxID=32597 RepID=A0A7J6M086_PEROL|nr:hypothetical protein FOZ61_000366 [Perkinsus olseni]